MLLGRFKSPLLKGVWGISGASMKALFAYMDVGKEREQERKLCLDACAINNISSVRGVASVSRLF